MEVSCSIFDVPFVIDIHKRKAELFNGGNVPVSASRKTTTAKAIAAVLKNHEKVKDHVVHVHDVLITQSQCLNMAKKYTPAGQTWIVTEPDADA